MAMTIPASVGEARPVTLTRSPSRIMAARTVSSRLPGQERPGCPLARRLPTFAGRLPTRLVLQWLAVRRLAVRRLVGGRRWLAVRVGLGVAVGGGLRGDRGRAVVAGLAAAAEGRVPAAHDREPPAGGRLRARSGARR